jgi:D-proline reductase (dithiol) PrdB
MPIAYIPRTRERYAAYPPYHWTVNHDAPWAPLPKPIRECRLALLSSGGFYLPDQPAFEDNDASYRRIPNDVDLRRLRIYHHFYRDDDVDRDPNCVFPLDRLRELVAAGVIGELAPYALSFLTIFSARREITERAPKLLAELQAMAVDAALLVPV